MQQYSNPLYMLFIYMLILFNGYKLCKKQRAITLESNKMLRDI